MNKNILIASRKHMISEGIRLRLLQEPDLSLISWAANLQQLDEICSNQLPSAILICGQFLESQTPRYIRDFVNRDIRANFMVFSNYVERHFVIEVMEAGAKGFVSPADTGFDEMVAALRSVANGNTYVCQKIAETLLGGLFNRNQPIETAILSDREKQVVRLVSDGHSSKEIARILVISPSTVEVHRRNIMRKIGCHKTADITRYAIRAQLVSA